jgi:hypothetical protein
MSERGHDHVFLTRFNLPSGGFESTVRSREGWLESRVALFERYCLPSMEQQDDPDFSWIVYFDPESPRWLHERIACWRGRGNLTPVFRPSVSPTELHDDVTDVAGSRRRRLVTTNLDNDDALAADFVTRFRAQAFDGGTTAVYMARGLIASGGRLFLRVDRVNAFCSVSTPWTSFETCWADWHNLLGSRMPVLTRYDAPAWLQVVHGRNVSNRVHGRLTSPARYASRFGALLDHLPEPTAAELSKDRLVGVPSRFMREASRAAAKRAIVAVGGRDALDTVRRAINRVPAALSGSRERGGDSR